MYSKCTKTSNMARERASISAQLASDVIYDQLCDRCCEEKRNSEAVIFCSDCIKRFCGECLKLHDGFFKGHCKIDKSETGKWITDVVKEDHASMTSRLISCPDHVGKELEMYCKDHDAVCCIICVTHSHRACVNLVPVPDVATGIKGSEAFQKFVSSLKIALEGENTYVKTGKDVQELIKAESDDIDAEIANVGHKLHEQVTEIKNSTKDQLEKVKSEILKRNNFLIQTSEKRLDELDSIHSKLLNADTTDKDIFIMIKRHKYEQFFSEKMSEASIRGFYRFKFVSNPRVCDSLQQVKTFGDFETTPKLKGPESRRRSTLANTQIGPNVLRPTLNVNHVYTIMRLRKHSFDTLSEDCMVNVKDICRLPGERTVLADCVNKVVFILDSFNKLTARLSFSAKPTCVCPVTSSEIAIGLQDESKSSYRIQIFDVATPTVTVTKHFYIAHQCDSIAYNNGNIYIAFGEGLFMYNLNGEYVKSLHSTPKKKPLVKQAVSKQRNVQNVSHVAVSDDGTRVYAIDNKRDCIATMDTDGKVLGTLKLPFGFGAFGICVSDNGTVFVSGRSGRTIIQIDKQGQKLLGTLATSTDRLRDPGPICFDRESSELYVAQDINDELVVLELK